jgi:hypothetical protein
MSEAGARGRPVTLRNVREVTAGIGLFRPARVTDALSGQQIGTARRRTMIFPTRLRALYWIWDMEGRVVIRMDQKNVRLPFDVFGGNGELIGSLVAKKFLDKRGRERPGNWESAWDAEGFVRIDAEDVASVRSGNIIDAQTGRQLARVSPSTGRASSGLRLHISDRVEGPLRLMALGWLGVAHHLDRAANLEQL